MATRTDDAGDRTRPPATALVDALARPRSFFAAGHGRRLRWAALVVAASAGLTAVTAVVVVLELGRLVPDGTLAWMVPAMVGASLLAGALGWLVQAAVLYALSWPLAEEGSFRGLLAPVGWAQLPQVVVGAVVFAATVVVVTQLAPPTDPETARQFARRLEGGSLIVLAAAAGTARASVTGSLSQVQAAAGVVGALWTGYCWTAALETVRGLGRRQAVAVAALPVALLALNGL